MATRRQARHRAPKVTTRKGPESIIAEVTGERGNGLLVEFAATRDGRNVYIRPYRADAGVYLEVRSHASDCQLTGHGKSERMRDTDSEVCDCGACLVYDAETFSWKPTVRA